MSGVFIFAIGNIPSFEIFSCYHDRNHRCCWWDQQNISFTQNIGVKIIEQFINFMLHFKVMLFKICVVCLAPSMKSDSILPDDIQECREIA